MTTRTRRTVRALPAPVAEPSARQRVDDDALHTPATLPDAVQMFATHTVEQRVVGRRMIAWQRRVVFARASDAVSPICGWRWGGSACTTTISVSDKQHGWRSATVGVEAARSKFGTPTIRLRSAYG